MASRRPSATTVILPWERRGGLVRRLRLGRARPVLLVALAISLIVLIASRERQKAGERSTRAALLTVHHALSAYRADHEGKCPPRLDELEKGGYLASLPDDAWGRPLRLVCPSRHDGRPYDLLSDGPDGLPAGLDRIE